MTPTLYQEERAVIELARHAAFNNRHLSPERAKVLLALIDRLLEDDGEDDR